tara:strand:- start:2597 stop:3115 length:519 start_codon:yes stop_codon:yes gene_type:complete
VEVDMSEPTNKNMLGQTGFRLVMDRLPTMTYFSQRVSLPTISLSGAATLVNPVLDYTLPGEKLTFGDLSVTFRVDEDMKNFLELYNWLVGLGAPESSNQYRRFQNASINQNVLSDGTLIILSSKYNPNIRVKFRGMFPESLSELQFETSAADIDYLEATATFKYRDYMIETV